jgi:hypothetical protein
MVWDVRVMIPVPNIKTEYPPSSVVPEVFFMDTIAGIGFQPEHYVDISSAFEIKKRMLTTHKSQASWLQDQYQMSYLEFTEYVARFRGLQCGARYAECFQSSLTWPRWCKPNLLP